MIIKKSLDYYIETFPETEGPVVRFYNHEIDFFPRNVYEEGAFLVSQRAKGFTKRAERCK